MRTKCKVFRKSELYKLAQELLNNHMGFKVALNKIVLLEFSGDENRVEYLLFKLPNSNVTYAYNDHIIWGKSLIAYPSMDCVNGMYVYDESTLRKGQNAE